MVVVDDAVVVLDVGTREVSAFDARTGSLRFSMAARGEGPGEFKRPSLLLARGTEFGVVDQATARLTMFSSRGAYLTDTPLTDAIALEGACLMSGGQLVAKVTGFDRALRTLDTSGIIRAQRSLPAPRRTSDNATFVSSAYVAGPAGQAACAIVPRFGSSWYVVAPSAAPIPHPYIEPGTDPSIEPTVKTLEKDWRSEIRTVTEISNIPPIARGALTIGDTLIVQAGATKRSPYLLLDYYHVPTGQYVYSRRLFAVFSALTMGADGAFYGALIGDENSAVVAFRPSIRRPAQNRASGIR
jgi:hypothetical protein